MKKFIQFLMLCWCVDIKVLHQTPGGSRKAECFSQISFWYFQYVFYMVLFPDLDNRLNVYSCGQEFTYTCKEYNFAAVLSFQ